jgi:hypothetical protein
VSTPIPPTITRNRFAWGIAALALLLILLDISKTSTIPSYVQIQSNYTSNQAEFYFAKATHELRQTYWSGIYDQVKRRQFNYAWNRLWNGPGAIYGVVTDLNSNVVAFVKLRNGEGFWIPVVGRAAVP